MTNKLTQWLGLAMRAGKVISGEELVIKAIRSNQAKVVVLSNDASHNTAKQIKDKSHTYNVHIIPIEDRYVLGNAIGKDQRVVVAITDAGFAKQIKQLE
ncbi:MAG: YlxQ family RNA-binding protein [Bacilli bacterium]